MAFDEIRTDSVAKMDTSSQRIVCSSVLVVSWEEFVLSGQTRRGGIIPPDRANLLLYRNSRWLYRVTQTSF